MSPKDIFCIMAELHQSSPHYEIIDPHPPKRINQYIKKKKEIEKKSQEGLFLQIFLFKL